MAIGEHEMRTDATRASILGETSASGVGWLRTDAYWAAIETSSGVYDWRYLDPLMRDAKSRGLKVLLVAHTTPAWLRPAGATDVYGPTTAAERVTYGRFVTALVNRYPDLGALEVWNEQNLDQFWAPTPNAASYVELLKVAYAASKAARPTLPVISGGLGGSTSELDILGTTYTQSFIEAGGLAYCDGFGYHPYPNPTQIGTDPQPTGGMWEASEVRKLLNAAGKTSLPIWATEVGAPTGGWYNTTEAGQATLVKQVAEYWFRNMGAVGPLFWYTLRDRSALTDREDFFGISGKPAFSAMQIETAKDSA